MSTLTPQPQKTLTVAPKKFLMWLFLISITMFFAALTSAYLVKRSQGDWIQFSVPSLFGYTTVVVAFSSLSMQLAYIYAKRNNLKLLKIMLVATLLLGLGFLVGQYAGWQQLIAEGIHFVGNPSGSFIYVLSGAHAIHLIGGLLYLLVLSTQALQYKVHSENMQPIEICATYWHFVGILWIYLYIFFILNH